MRNWIWTCLGQQEVTEVFPEHPIFSEGWVRIVVMTPAPGRTGPIRTFKDSDPGCLEGEHACDFLGWVVTELTELQKKTIEAIEEGRI